MDFKNGDMIVLNDESKSHFKSTVHSTIFVVLKEHTNPILIYVYKLGVQPNSETYIAKQYFRRATEAEIKTFKLKNLF
jgi:hypothetical protein